MYFTKKQVKPLLEIMKENTKPGGREVFTRLYIENGIWKVTDGYILVWGKSAIADNIYITYEELLKWYKLADQKHDWLSDIAISVNDKVKFEKIDGLLPFPDIKPILKSDGLDKSGCVNINSKFIKQAAAILGQDEIQIDTCINGKRKFVYIQPYGQYKTFNETEVGVIIMPLK
jgi:hypothetical protein